jgi:Ca2+-binding EF-hand superfamily protein
MISNGERQVRAMLEEADTDGDGKIDFSEFSRLLPLLSGEPAGQTA